MTPKRQGKKGTRSAEKATLAGLTAGRRGQPAENPAAQAGRRGPGRPQKHPEGEKPQRVGVYLPSDLVGWLLEETARRKRDRRDASISEIVAEAVTALRAKRGDR